MYTRIGRRRMFYKDRTEKGCKQEEDEEGMSKRIGRRRIVYKDRT